jgi:hypothetical protein
MVFLVDTNDAVEVITTSTSATDYNVEFVDVSTSTFAINLIGSNDGQITSATTTTVISAPGAGVARQVKGISLKNVGSAANTITIQKDNNGTNRQLTPAVTLSAGESVFLDEFGKLTVYDTNGRIKNINVNIQGYSGRSIQFYKVGTTAEAVGVRHSLHAATGFPGAWSPGTPGVAGRTTDGTTSTDGGCLPLVNPSTGANYLTQFAAASSVAQFILLMDILWVNSGIVVTTTTAQTINSVAFPARDLNGSTNGEGVDVGILVTTATTNSSAITNTTMSYTNSDGVSGRTATISSFPATAVAGTFVPFQLQAGDKGVRSIQSITLGTSYGGGAISLIAFTTLGAVPSTVVNIGGNMSEFNATMNPGVRLYNGACLILYYLASATTATNVTGLITVMER